MSLLYPFIYFVFCVLIMSFINYSLIKKKTPIERNTKNEISITTNTSNSDNTISTPNNKLGRILFILMLGMFITILNQTTIDVIIPTIMNQMNVSTSTVQWLTNGFMLTNGILIPISAFLVETYGFRKLFIFAITSFAIGSLICAISGTFPVLLTGRVVQAIGAGILMPLGTNIFVTIFPPEKRGVAMGTMGISMILAPAIGPTLAGWVVEHYNWSFLFFGNFVLGIICILFAIPWFHLNKELSKPTFDFQGILYSSLGFGGILYGFSEASNSWTSTKVVISLSLGSFFVVLFVWRQLTSGKPLLDLKVFKFKFFTFTLIINSVITMALYGGLLLLPVYLQSIRGFTPLQAGMLLLPGSLIMGIMSPISGKIFDKYGVRVLAIVGLTITSYATYELTKLTNQTPYSSILGIYMLRSFGMSMLTMPIMTAGMNSLPQYLIPHGTALMNTIRQIAGAVGTALLVTIMTQQTNIHLANFSSSLTKTNSFFTNQLGQFGSTGTMSLYGLVSKTSMINGINDAFLVATIFGLIALVLSFFLQSPKKIASIEN